MSSKISLEADIFPEAKIGNGCKMFPFAHIEDDVVVGDDCIIFPFVSILNGTRTGNGNKIRRGSVLAVLSQGFESMDEKNKPIIGNNNIIRENVVINRTIHRGCRIALGSNSFLVESAHISHDTAVGDRCVFGYGAKVVGDRNIGTDALISPNVIEKTNTRVGEHAVVRAGTTFSEDVPPYVIAGSSPIGYRGINTTISKIADVDDRVLKHIVNARRLSFHGRTSVFDVCIQIEQQVPDPPEIHNVFEFVHGTEEGTTSRS